MKKLSHDEIQKSLSMESVPPILSTKDLADFLRVPIKTVYVWVGAGHFDGSFRRRGKRLLFWRDRVIEIIFNKGDWN